MKILDVNPSIPKSIEPAPSFLRDHFYVLTPQCVNGDSIDTPRYLVTLDKGIGDALVVGLSAIDQIIVNDSTASGKIDVLCSPRQSEIFRYDPRVNRIIETPLTFYPSPERSSWYKLLAPESKARELLHFLRGRQYEAVFPSTIAPALYIRLHAHLMLPDVLNLANDIFLPDCTKIDRSGTLCAGW